MKSGRPPRQQEGAEAAQAFFKVDRILPPNRHRHDKSSVHGECGCGRHRTQIAAFSTARRRSCRPSGRGNRPGDRASRPGYVSISLGSREKLLRVVVARSSGARSLGARRWYSATRSGADRSRIHHASPSGCRTGRRARRPVSAPSAWIRGRCSGRLQDVARGWSMRVWRRPRKGEGCASSRVGGNYRRCLSRLGTATHPPITGVLFILRTGTVARAPHARPA